MKYLTVFSLFCLILSGCAANVHTQTAQDNVLDKAQGVSVYKMLPSVNWMQLDNAGIGTSMVIDNSHVLLGKKYFSASGAICRQLNWMADESGSIQNKTVCKNNKEKQWYLVKPIVVPHEEFYELVNK